MELCGSLQGATCASCLCPRVCSSVTLEALPLLAFVAAPDIPHSEAFQLLQAPPVAAPDARGRSTHPRSAREVLQRALLEASEEPTREGALPRQQWRPAALAREELQALPPTSVFVVWPAAGPAREYNVLPLLQPLFFACLEPPGASPIILCSRCHRFARQAEVGILGGCHLCLGALPAVLPAAASAERGRLTS